MHLNLPPLPSVRNIIKLYRLRAAKQLSQNFLLYEPKINKIVKSAGRLKGCHVVEVGPGPGSITRVILQKMPKKLTVIERDVRFQPVLELLAESFAMVNGKMDMIYSDILLTELTNYLDQELKMDWEDNSPNIHIIGNLPFNISTPLIIRWLHDISERRNAWSMGRVPMTLTFQKEVAERLVTDVRTPQRCRLSIMAQAWTHPKLKLIIPGKYFVPKPDVDVGVVKFSPLVKPRTAHKFQLFEKVTRHIFSFRQKYSIKGYSTLLPPEYREILGPVMYQMAEVDPETRPPQLQVEDVDRLCTAYQYMCSKHREIELYDYHASRKVLNNKYITDIDIMDFDEEDNVEDNVEDEIKEKKVMEH